MWYKSTDVSSRQEVFLSTITCSARTGEVEYFEIRAVVHFMAENMLGENGEGVPTADEQRRAARRQKYYRAPALMLGSESPAAPVILQWIL